MEWLRLRLASWLLPKNSKGWHIVSRTKIYQNSAEVDELVRSLYQPANVTKDNARKR